MRPKTAASAHHSDPRTAPDQPTPPGNSASPAVVSEAGWTSSLRTMLNPSTPAAILTDLAPQIFHATPFIGPRSSLYDSSASTSSSSSSSSALSSTSRIRSRLGLGWSSTPAFAPHASTSLYIREKVDDLLRLEVPASPFDLSTSDAFSTANSTCNSKRTIHAAQSAPDLAVPLFRGFQATAPAARSARQERRRRRAGLGEIALGLENIKLGLKDRGQQARGILSDEASSTLASASAAAQADQVQLLRKRRSARRSEVLQLRGRSSSARYDPAAVGEVHAQENAPVMTADELEADSRAVEEDMGNVAVRRSLLNAQILEIDEKMAALDSIREELKRSLLFLREEELELQDEFDGLRERMNSQTKTATTTTTSRRRKGPAFLPGEHDDLPSGVAFMVSCPARTLSGHLGPVSALDFSEPYGVAVSASQDETVRLWDLSTGDEMGQLRGHQGVVKALQVEASVCITGGSDGQVRIWNVDEVEDLLTSPNGLGENEDDGGVPSFEKVFLGRANGYVGGREALGTLSESVNGEEGGEAREEQHSGACVKVLDGHTKAVTSLYFDGPCLVTGSSDSTLRQWDIHTGQNVMTMDVLWAISNPSPLDNLDPSEPYSTPASSPRKSLAALRRHSSTSGTALSFSGYPSSPATTNYADGSFEPYEDFVGGVQFWGYALASGTADGCVRMWDMRTGQSHRTLVGHTGPVSCVQFDEHHLVSGSLDKTVRIWDIRTGSISDTIRYDYPITSLQFDSRKIVAAAGENGIRVFNRTTLQHTALTLNGHTRPAERLRFMDSYLMSGGRDHTVKVWKM
ncbi:BZ3500_MvSof-1268-A1-R1_Chr1-1g01207 [Microbotryum saponariae]|uniref:BZ3500_MvSof-1268-A1-R1_Chr1-1g01207 protein n=1 Tax=Microbotryum saponariae TaxID=289078 RepID=A0A2X0KQ89_9BASI|nr:BZ3500_MvSof-1268-A1-R1_Chr1-1g01207 [Microbotryum saponariae]SCZ93666.1 BZ3501_MvSof-1269-A2-R1_Chr1-1g00803 [Microbotryum saponariae]